MQRCEKCGQINNNYEERCVYCGEFLYISVDHDDRQYDSQDDNDFTSQIIEELTNSNNEAAQYMDIDDNPFTKTIEDNSYHENSRSRDTFMDDEDEFINDRDVNFRDIELNKHNRDDEDLFEDDDGLFEVNDNPFEDDSGFDDSQNPEMPPKKQHLIDLEEDLKKKIKRNKKLENSLGIRFTDIDVEVSSIRNPIEISGRAIFNQNKTKEDYKLSIICYDVLKNKLERKEIILENNDTESIKFNTTIHPNIHKTAMIILLPEIIETEAPEENIPDVNYHVRAESIKNIFIEQMHDIERKIGMKIDNTSVLLKSDRKIEIVGEIYIKTPDKYNTIIITATCYDKNNYIIATESTKINTKLYLGFDTLRLIVSDVDVDKIQRIKIYPTLQGLDY